MSTKFRSKKNNDTATIPRRFLLRPHRLSFRNHHRWIPYTIGRDEIAICRETGFHHLGSKQKKTLRTHNPPNHSENLTHPGKSSRKKTKWLGLKKGWSVDSRIPMGKVWSAWTCWAQLRWPILSKSIFRLHPETSVALWKQSNMKYVYIHIYRFHRFQVLTHTSTYHVGKLAFPLSPATWSRTQCSEKSKSSTLPMYSRKLSLETIFTWHPDGNTQQLCQFE